MMDETSKWVVIMFTVMFMSFMTALSVTVFFDSNIKIACYEAAKVNQNIKCEGKK